MQLDALRHYSRIFVLLPLITLPSLFLEGRSHAEDLDVPAAQARYDRERTEADRAKSLYDRELQTHTTLERQLNNAEAEETSAERALNAARLELDRIDRDINRVTTEIDQLRFDRDRYNRQRNDAAAELPDLKRRRDQLADEKQDLQRAVREMERTIRDIENSPRTGPWTCCYVDRGWEEHSGGHCADDRDKSAAMRLAEEECLSVHGNCELSSCEQPEPPELADMRRQLEFLRNDLSDVERRLATAENNVTSKEREIRDLDGQISQTERSIASKQSELNQLRSNRTSTLNRISIAERDLRDARDNVRLAQQALDRHQPALDAARRDWNLAESEAQTAWNYLQQVIANYNAALNRVLARADAEATQHSAREAGDRAPETSENHGRRDARSVGEAAGAKEGAERDLARGYRIGRQEGASNPSLANAYNTGKNLGAQIAENKAGAEDFPRGYNDALDRLLGGAPELTSTVDITDSIGTEPGDNGRDIDPRKKPIGSVTDPGYTPPSEPAYQVPTAGNPSFSTPAADFRYRQYPCSGLPLVEFEPKCREQYDATYRSKFGSSYNSTYISSYRQTFANNVRSHYDQALARSYDESRIQGMQTGATHQGTLDGFAQSLPAARDRQYNEGTRSVAALLATGHLLIVRQITLVEPSGDGLFSSGETAKLRVVIDNYGLKSSPKSKLRVRIASKTNVGSINFDLRELPALAANTRTTLEGVVSAKIAAAVARSKAQLIGSLEIKPEGGAYTELERMQPEAEIRFPLEITGLTLAKIPRVDEEVAAKLRIVNNTASTLDAKEIVLGTNPAIVSFPGGPFQTTAVDAGATSEVDVKVKPGIWVSDDIPVNVLGQVKEAAGVVTTEQIFPQLIALQRNGSLLLKDRLGQPVPSGTLDAIAGQTIRFKVQFKFLSDRRQPGPFVVRYTQASDPAIRPANNSTISVNYGSWAPGSTASPIDFAFDIPVSLRGKDGWIMIQLNDGNSPAHALQIKLRIR